MPESDCAVGSLCCEMSVLSIEMLLVASRGSGGAHVSLWRPPLCVALVLEEGSGLSC